MVRVYVSVKASNRSRGVFLAIGIAVSACGDATGPDTIHAARLHEVQLLALREATLFGGSVSDAAQRVVPTVPNAGLRRQLLVALDDLSFALEQLSWTRTTSAVARSLSALELCERIQGLEGSEAAELEVIRLSLMAIDQIVRPAANGINTAPER